MKITKKWIIYWIVLAAIWAFNIGMFIQRKFFPPKMVEHTVKFTNISDLDPDDPKVKQFKRDLAPFMPMIMSNFSNWIKEQEESNE